ncbi:hypothetical protein [Herbidospora mongoliensis]|uniref:hypothetical protein n=1 Tax=Herbidospora mongoliensis TaxID=688067 RepID=UPI00082B034D|nr:hypothetical protein [Herbidospora mongoliensis]
MLALGFTEPTTAAITAVTMAGGVEIAGRLTLPQLAPLVRILVIVLICVIVVVLLHRGYGPVLAVLIAVGTAGVAGEIARRFAGINYRLPRLVF